MAHSSKRQIDELLLMSLACGATLENAATKAGVNKRTAIRRMADPAFVQRLRELKDGMVKRAAAMLTAAAMEGVKTLTNLLGQETPPAVRLGAARAILELGVRLRESAELHERVTALEQQTNAQILPPEAYTVA